MNYSRNIYTGLRWNLLRSAIRTTKFRRTHVRHYVADMGWVLTYMGWALSTRFSAEKRTNPASYDYRTTKASYVRQFRFSWDREPHQVKLLPILSKEKTLQYYVYLVSVLTPKTKNFLIVKTIRI